MMVAPVHRPWGNRVIRESKILENSGYEITALLKTEKTQKLGGMVIMPASSSENRAFRVMQFIKNFWTAYRFEADIYHLHNPDTIPIALLLKLAGKKVIYDTHEDFSRRLLMRTWIPIRFRKLMCRFVTTMEKFTSKIVNAMFVTQSDQLRHFSNKTHLLRNAPYINASIREQAHQLALKIESDEKDLRLIYAGGISKERGIFTMLDALVICNQTTSIRLWLAGEDMTNVLNKAKAHEGWKFVDYLGLLPQEQVFAYYSKSAIGLAVLSDIGDHSTAKPSKLFEYMGFGLPFIATDFKDWREFIEPCVPGWWIKPDNADVLSKTIITALEDKALLSEKSERGKSFISDFNWENESQILTDIYQELLVRS